MGDTLHRPGVFAAVPPGQRFAAAALYPLSHVGFRDALQAVLKSFDIAVEQYARVSGTHGYDLELTATDKGRRSRLGAV